MFASFMEAYGLTLTQVLNNFNYGQIILLGKISECKAKDMEREIDKPKGKQINRDNKAAAEIFASGI